MLRTQTKLQSAPSTPVQPSLAEPAFLLPDQLGERDPASPCIRTAFQASSSSTRLCSTPGHADRDDHGFPHELKHVLGGANRPTAYLDINTQSLPFTDTQTAFSADSSVKHSCWPGYLEDRFVNLHFRPHAFFHQDGFSLSKNLQSLVDIAPSLPGQRLSP